MSPLTPAQALALSPAELARATPSQLLQLKQQIQQQLSLAKQLTEHIDCALDLRYAETARQLRRAVAKDCGTVHFSDEAVQITAELPKRVEWDQQRLAEITRRIVADGDDPAEYVEISYRVPESRFNAWPESLKRAFAPARTVRPGKASYQLTLSQASS